VENFVDVHEMKRNNMMNKATCKDNLNILMIPMLLPFSRGFPDEAAHCTTEDTKREDENLWPYFSNLTN